MSGSEPVRPPLTNRGSLTPHDENNERDNGVLFHLDYLRLTVFVDAAEAKRLVESGLYDNAHFEYRAWENKGQGKRWEAIYTNVGPVAVLVPKYEKAGYCQIELKGEACNLFLSHQLQGFMRYIQDCGHRWHASRIDLAFDYVAFTPTDVWLAINKRDFNSRCLKFEDRDWRQNDLGDTAYLGTRYQKKERKLRVYDKRGYTRFEAEFSDKWARTAARHFMQADVKDWPTEAMGLVRGMIDFINRSANERVERCPQLDWWSDFVGDVEKIRQLDEQDQQRYEREQMENVIAETERRIERVARQLLPISMAWGADYLHKRLYEHGWLKMKDQDDKFMRELRRLGVKDVNKWLKDQGDLDFLPF